MRRLALLIATCGYLGYVPIAPGTFGSALGLLVFYAVRMTGSPAFELTAIAVVFGDASVGYATARGSIQRTTDGGATWAQLRTPGTF